MHSFPLTHAEPPHELVLPTGRTLGVLAAASAIPEYRIAPQRGSLLCDRLILHEFRGAVGEEVAQLVSRHRSREQVSLAQVAAEALQ